MLLPGKLGRFWKIYDQNGLAANDRGRTKAGKESDV